MSVSLRIYRGPEDLDLQNAFWVQATRDLPWCWKPTISPALYAQRARFDPRSRCFAFDDERLVGYMSFTGQGEFVSLGYPWVLPGYEGELQEILYDAVYAFAAGAEYGGKRFAQRLRGQWTNQIRFFERHGFEAQSIGPILAFDLRSALDPQSWVSGHVELREEFCWDDFYRLSAGRATPEQGAMLKQYLETVDFDFAIKATHGGHTVGTIGVAIRPDTRFAEMIAVAIAPKAPDALISCLSAAVRHARSRKAEFLGTKPIAMDGSIDVLTYMGFQHVSNELLFSKNI
jgi:hypothetical protein